MLEVALLGPVEARVSGVGVALSPLERNLLAVLALSKGAVISTERIIDCLWDERPPVSPRSRVQGLISSLRRKIGDELITRHPGYLLSVPDEAIDIAKCHELARQGRLAGAPSETAQGLRSALALWRGDPLDGVSAPGIDVDRARLHEMRIGLLEERFDAELQAGNHADLIAELQATVAAHPLRERLAGQLMLALYRCNRQADALKAYQALRDRLAEELGSDPCADLRNLHATILRGDTAQAHPPPEPVNELRPAQLPASVGHFTGRERELASLTLAVNRPHDEPRVFLVSGTGGLGKTALVVRWAHAVSEVFPDGQIFVDLHGRKEGEWLSAATALAAVLNALGVPKQDVPAALDERAALYRTLISSKRVLIIADDARSADQLLPLVPPTPASQMVATSRRRLPVLAAHHAVQEFSVEPLAPHAARYLLGRIVGEDRLRDPAAETILQWCGGWPLALRLAGAKLAARPGQLLSSFAAELGDDLMIDDDPRSVRAALMYAHNDLSPAAAHLFGRLGRYPGPTLTLRLTAAAADASVHRVRQLLDELISAHLIVETGPDCYRFHDVVRRFARHCSAELIDRDAVDEWMHRSHAVS